MGGITLKKFELDQLIPPKGIDLLCENLVSAKFEDLSEENIEIFRDRLLDMIGCIFGGACVEEDAFLADMYRGWGGAAEAPMFANTGRIPAINAISYNSILARANDFGNMVSYVHGDRIASHFGETVIPTNLTFADMFPTTGREFITRNIAAEDTIGRILYTLPNRWPTDMLLGAPIAAALISRIYGFNAAQAKAAMSYAATNNSDPGNAYFDYSQEYKLFNGESARVGMLSCEVVKHGWNGLVDPFFGHWGIISKQLKDGETLPALYQKAFEGLGEVFFTESSFKRCPGGIPTTVAANLGKELRARIIEKYGKVDADAIRQVHLYRSSTIRENYYSQPFTMRNHINALFCFRFASCCCLLHGTLTVKSAQTSSILADPALIELTENATMGVYECEPGRQMMKLVVDMKDGSTLQAEADYAAAMYEYPSKEFIRDKFLSQFNDFGKLPAATAQKIIELCGKVELLPDMRELTELLVLK